MKRTRMKSALFLMFGSSASILIAVFFLVLGLSAGTFSSMFLSVAEKEQILSILSKYLLFTNVSAQPDFLDVFLNSLQSNLGLLLIILLAGITIFGFPAALIALTYKGMAIGFSSAILIESMSYQGIAVTLASMVPQNILILPGLLLASIAAVHFAVDAIRSRTSGIRKSLSYGTGSYFLVFLPAILLIIFGCLIESAFCPFLIQLIV